MSKQRRPATSQRTSVELFAGAGGLAMAAERAGFRPLLLNEFAKRACETLVANGAASYEGAECPPIPAIGDKPPLIMGDVRNVKFDYLVDKVDLLAGGPPCQPFSLGGVARGDEDDRNGFPHMFRAISEMRPRAVICENVRGLLRPSFSPYFDYIKRELSLPWLKRPEGSDWRDHNETLRAEMKSASIHDDERYEVEHFAVNAADYGVPQIRNRVIIVAFRRDLGVDWNWFRKLVKPKFSERLLYQDMLPNGAYWDRHEIPSSLRKPVPNKSQVFQQAALLPEDEGLAPWRTLRDAIRGIEDGQEPLPEIPSHLLDRQPHFGDPDHVGWPNARIYDGHTPNQLDRPAKTVKAGVHGVPGGESVVQLDDGTHRYMTVRETARVMTFPDQRTLAGPRGEKMRQLGNAVPVLLGKAFTEAVSMALELAGGDEAKESSGR
ncbi:DNA cytosine methyltransferase [Nocardia testacea]|uniref:DNA cytosine methyltransferase n=1 Tax=Nocardia testacea TaxID=248551 RepID=UPI003A8C80D0